MNKRLVCPVGLLAAGADQADFAKIANNGTELSCKCFEQRVAELSQHPNLATGRRPDPASHVQVLSP